LDITRVGELIDGVPPFERFRHIDELEEESRELAKRYPESVEWREIGKSSEGRPITALLIGDGDWSVLMYGFTHPNEPIGSLTVEYLASRLAASTDLRKRLGCRFILVKAVDVDGAKLNEGWFSGPFNLLTYAENYYRPPPNEQAEWTFPIHYKTLHYDTPIPETQAIKKVVDEFRRNSRTYCTTRISAASTTTSVNPCLKHTVTCRIFHNPRDCPYIEANLRTSHT